MIFCAAVSALPLGCAQSRPLTADMFAPPPVVDLPPVHAAPIHDGGSDSSAVAADVSTPTRTVILTPLQPQTLGAIPPLEALDTAAKPAPVDPPAQMASAVIPPVSAVSPLTAQPAPVPGTSTGVYMSVGGVIAEVNGTPIYTCQVLHKIAKALTAKGRDLDETAFRRFATDEILRQRDELIRDEVIFHVALDQLDEKDRELAQVVTINMKQERITAAGGSLEAAKRKSLAEGQDFDEAMTQTYREIVHMLVEHKVIEPMVKISRDDEYRFYTQNFNKLFSEKSKVLFRVIQMDPAAMKGADPEKTALDKITSIHEKAIRGAEFIALASADNTDSYLKSHGGDPGGWMEPNTYRLEEVEKAVWQLQLGEVTPVIKCNGAYYIAKLFDKKVGTVKPFDDAEVQWNIYAVLREQQISEHWRMIEDQLKGGNEIIDPDDRVELAVDLAMQRYKIQNTVASTAETPVLPVPVGPN
jgi:parvulin-like peptidyl-prolyl isomerase